MSSRRLFRTLAAVVAAGVVLLCSAAAPAQGVDARNRPIDAIKIEGLKQVPDKLVRNQVRSQVGEAYNPEVVREDIVRITHLGRFNSVQARVEQQPGGGVVLTYVVGEQRLLSDVQVVGNKAITDQELLNHVQLKAGDPMDTFLIDRGVNEIKKAYEKAGYFVTAVTVDKEALEESGILLYHIREGPQPSIRGIQYKGNKAYTDEQLQSKIRSNTHIFIFRKGELSREQLDADAERVRDFYRENGYLDAQVGRRIDLGPDQKNAVVVFLIQEGQRYTVDQVRIEGNKVFSAEQIMRAMDLKVGDVFSADRLRKTQESVANYIGRIGYIQARVTVERLFHEDKPLVDVVVKIDEGIPYLVGTVSARGNELTKDKVVLRQVRGLYPGERFDREGIATTERRLSESSLFSDGKVTVLGEEGDPSRDVLVTVKERNTGSLSFGAGISSDAGVIGAIDLIQRNFDIADIPESAGEFFTGKAFRGAGQYFQISLQPGNQTSRYSINFREPYLLDSNYFLDTTAFYFSRVRPQYDEQRIGGNVGIGQRFGDVWSASLRARGEQVDITHIDKAAPQDVFDVRGSSIIATLGVGVTRNTTDSRVFPTQGSKWDIGLSRAGLIGGDYDYYNASSDYHKFWTVDEDFFGRRTVISVRNEIGYIFDASYTSVDTGNTVDDAPVFDRLYAGGERSFRGFRFRGVGPRGLRHDSGTVGGDPVGGDFLFLLSLEYNFPIFEDVIRWVFFTDTGTVQHDVGFDEYRVSVGTGIRIKIPFLGQAPFALDVAYPLVKQSGDQTRFLSFDLAVPF